MRSIPPAPDPCLVSLRNADGSPLGGRRGEKQWIKARNCPQGCGSQCEKMAEPKWPDDYRGWGSNVKPKKQR